MENYEQKYKEALEKLRAFHRDYKNISHLVDVKEELESIFPELAESEDEMIIKEIISIVKTYRESCIKEGNHRFDDCLAWLEKQGEHANFRNKIQIGDKVTRNEAGVLVNLSQLERVAKPANTEK